MLRLSSRSPGPRALTLLQFQQLLLSGTYNNAEDAAALAEVDDGHAITEYWVSCSHNTYSTADQLQSRSSAEMYRRVLLQAGSKCLG